VPCEGPAIVLGGENEGVRDEGYDGGGRWKEEKRGVEMVSKLGTLALFGHLFVPYT